jgi:hypothetical protein
VKVEVATHVDGVVGSEARASLGCCYRSVVVVSG